MPANARHADPHAELDLDRLAAAKLWLITTERMPYLSAAIYSMITVGTRKVARLSADTHWRLYVNPDWLNGAQIPDIAARLAEVVWHLLGAHAERAFDMGVGPDQADTWHQAADATIAGLLDRAGIEHTVPGPIQLNLPEGLAVEQYYAILGRLPVDDEPPEQPDQQEQDGQPGQDGHDGQDAPADDCGSAADGLPRPYELSPADAVGALDRHGAEHVRRQVAIEYRADLLRRGDEPGCWGRWIADILDPVVPWAQVLASAVRRAFGWASGRTDFTYSRPSRRQSSSPNVILPATRRPLPEVAVVVDSSGSVDDGLLAQAMGEVEGVLTGLGVPGRKLTVLVVDAAMQTVGRVSSARDVPLAGGGGTDMRIGIDAARALRPPVDIVIVLTDGGTLWPTSPPERVALIAVIIGRSKAELPATPPWLQRIECVPH
ncbi:MAG: VWA-like domain-containing protein [Actinomycetes bacterium]